MQSGLRDIVFEHDLGADPAVIKKLVEDVREGNFETASGLRDVFYHKLGFDLFDNGTENLTPQEFSVTKSSFNGYGEYDSVTLGHYREQFGEHTQDSRQEVKIQALLDTEHLGFVDRSDGQVSFEDEAKLIISGHVRSNTIDKLQDFINSDDCYKMPVQMRNLYRSALAKDAYTEKMEEFEDIFVEIRKRGYVPRLSIDENDGRCGVTVYNKEQTDYICCQCDNVEQFSKNFFKESSEIICITQLFPFSFNKGIF